MSHDRLLPLSILCLAAAVALHAVAPAHADDAPAAEPAPPPVEAAAPVAEPTSMDPSCRMIRLGTAKEMEKHLGELRKAGAQDVLVLGTGLVCGW